MFVTERLRGNQEIERVHQSKIYAYLCFGILRHKPLKIKDAEGVAELVFINEEFVC